MSPTANSAARRTSEVHPGQQISAEQLGVLRTMLEEQRQFRLEQLEQLRRTDQLGLLSGNDIQISESLTSGARAALRDVVEALHRMDEGRYGRCRRCQAAVPIERLEILPQVALCMNCQREDEPT